MPSFYIEVYGCSLNKAEAKIIEQNLLAHSYKKAPLPKADYIIINTCGVKDPTENKILKRIREIQKLKKKTSKLIIYGCLVDISPSKMEEFPSAYKIGVNPKELFSLFGIKENFEPAFLENPFVAIIPINQGCINNCSFCATKKARGNLKSYSPSLLRSAFKKAIEKRPEVWLTSPDTGCYGFDIDTNLPSLLKKFLENSEDFFIRLGMMNPNNYRIIENKLLNLFEKDERLFRFLHLPLQSGSNKILSLMKRPYTKEVFISQIEKIRELDYKFTISTDIIVGFPEEDEKDFEQTKDAIFKTQPDIINISRYYPRPNTEASKMKQILGRTQKQRSREITSIAKELSKKRNLLHLGKQKILVDEKGKARNRYYKTILCPSCKIGKFMEKEITYADYFYLK